MKARKWFGPGWWLVTMMAAMFMGWWLAMRTMASRAGMSSAVVLEPAALCSAVVEVPAPTLAVIPLSKRAEDFLTVKEIARHLGVSEKTVRRELDEGRMPLVRMRGKVTVKGSDVLAWLSARREA